MTAFREVAEAEATDDVALVFEEIRRTYAVPYVSSLFRHLAVYPGLLPWAWGILRPALLSGAVQHLAWQRVDVTELPPLPPPHPGGTRPISGSMPRASRRSARSARASPG